MITTSRKKLLLPLAVAAVTLLVGLIAGCGGGSGPDAKQIIKDTFSNGKDVKSGVVNAEVKGTVDGNIQQPQGLKIPFKFQKGPVDFKLSGPFDTTDTSQVPKFDFDFSAQAGDQISIGLVSTGDAGYVNYKGSAYQIPEQIWSTVSSSYAQSAKKSGKQAGGGANANLKALGVDPSSWFTDVKKESDANVGGTDTYVVSGSVDVSKAFDEASKAADQAQPGGGLGGPMGGPQQLTDKQKQELKDSFKNLTFKVYTGKSDMILRKLEVSGGFTVPADQQQSASGVKSVDLSFTVEYSDVNKPQDVKAPTNTKPFDDLLKALGLGDLGGALSGLSGMPGAGGAVPQMPGGAGLPQ